MPNYTLVQRPDKSCDVYEHGKLIGVWKFLTFYPEPDYLAPADLSRPSGRGVTLELMRFLSREGTSHTYKELHRD